MNKEINVGIVSILSAGCAAIGESEDKIFAFDESDNIRGISESNIIPYGFTTCDGFNSELLIFELKE